MIKYLSQLLKREDSQYHIKFYLKWGWFLPPIWVIQILYRECITAGHLKRIHNNTETKAALLDFKEDLFTRFLGLSIPLLIESIILILIVA